MTHEIFHDRDLHEPHFSRHVEQAADVFWMRRNPLGESLQKIHENLHSKNFTLHNENGGDAHSGDHEKIVRSCERLLESVFKSCDAYLAAYYDFILINQQDITLENRADIQTTDTIRRRSHLALTTNIRILARNLKTWGINTYDIDAFVLEDDLDTRRIEIGNLALHLAFSRYISS